MGKIIKIKMSLNLEKSGRTRYTNTMGKREKVRGPLPWGRLIRAKLPLMVSVSLLIVASAGCSDHGRGERGREAWPAARGPEPAHRFGEQIHLAAEGPGMITGRRDLKGRHLRVGCPTCHQQMVPPAPGGAEAPAPREFHRGVVLAHGGQTCRTCHQAPRFDTFRLSSGERLPYHRVMELCGQCHSGQYRDYQNGVHGGMAGHWDLDTGPRDRNHCLDCHNPHRPAIPRQRPAPRPRYRFLDERHPAHSTASRKPPRAGRSSP